jgi:uncharacterized protein
MTLVNEHGHMAAPSARPDGAHLAIKRLFVAAVAAATGIALASPYPWAVLVPLVFSPIAEEAIFRAGIQEWLLRRAFPEWWTNVATAVAFAMTHSLLRGVSVSSAAVLIPALMLSWTYGQFRSLRLCIGLHMLMNALWLAAGRHLPVLPYLP